MGWIPDMWSRKTARPEMNFNIGGEPEDIRKALEQSRNEAGQQPKDPDEPVFLTDPQFEALKVVRGYPKHYLGSRTASESSWAFRYAHDNRNAIGDL